MVARSSLACGQCMRARLCAASRALLFSRGTLAAICRSIICIAGAACEEEVQAHCVCMPGEVSTPMTMGLKWGAMTRMQGLCTALGCCTYPTSHWHCLPEPC